MKQTVFNQKTDKITPDSPQVGEVVRLISGGPRMSVVRSAETTDSPPGSVLCCWYQSDKGSFDEREFLAATLTLEDSSDD